MIKNRFIHYSVILILILAVLAAVIIRFSEPLNDGDIWFHLAYGRYFIENRTLIPDHSVFSWTPAENRTIYCAWASEIISYALFKAGGLNALYALRYIIIIIFIALSFPLSLRNRTGLIPVLLLIYLTGLLMSYSGLRIKPEIFSFLLMTFMVWAWFRIKSDPGRSWLSCYIFPLISLIWVNTHGSFIFGMVFLAVILSGEVLNWLTGSPERLGERIRKHLMISVALSVAVLLINPYGWRYPAQIVNDLILNPAEISSHMKTVAEYQSIFFPSASVLHFMDYLIISSLMLLILFAVQIRRHKTDWTLILMNVSFLVIYARFLRVTYLWGIIFVFSSNYLLRKLYEDRLELSLKKTLTTAAQAASALAILFFAVRTLYDVFCLPAIGFNTNYVCPRDEAEFIRTNLSGLRMGNDYYCGSYLLWSLWPAEKVFIDARYFPYKKWYLEYSGLDENSDKTQIENFLNKYECDFWCIAYETSFFQYFTASPDWSLAYYGPSACVFISKNVNYPLHGHSVPKSIYNVGLYQAYSIVKFATLRGEVDVAREIIKTMRPVPFCADQKNLVINASLNLGNYLLALKRYHEAIEIYSNTLADESGSLLFRYFPGKYRITDVAMLHDNLGYSYMMETQMYDAVKEYGIALEMKPDAPYAQKYLPLVKTQMAKIDEAIVKLTDALKVHPDNVDLLNTLAIQYSLKGEYETALEYFMRELKIKPNNSRIYYNIACLYSRQGKVKDSISYLDMAIKKGFNDWQLLQNDHDLDNIRNTPYFSTLKANI